MNHDITGQGISAGLPQTPRRVEIGSAQLSTRPPEGFLESSIERVRTSNQRIAELIACQQDKICRLTGNNPITVDPEKEAVRPEGLQYELAEALGETERLIGHLNTLTDAWQII